MRLSVMAGALAAGAAFLAGGVEASAADKITWNLSTFGPPRAFTKGVETIAKQVEEKSNGNFTIKIHYAEAIAPSKENLDGIKIGAFEAAQMCGSYHPGKTPLQGVLDLPFLPLPTADIQQQVHEAVFRHGAIVEEMKRWNGMLFQSGLLPQYEFMGAGKAPEGLDDWKGMRVRALGGLGEAMRVLGAVPTSVPSPEIYTALERGMITAASLPFSYAHAAYRLQEVSKWYTMGMAPGTTSCPTVVNIAAFEALPAEYREMLVNAKAPAYEALKAGYKEADDKGIPTFDKAGLKRLAYSAEQHQKFQESAGKPVWKKWASDMEARNLPGPELLDFVLAQAKLAAGF